MAEPTTYAETDATEEQMTEAIAASQQEALNSIAAAGTAMFDGLTEARTEISDFISHRIRQDMETQAEMLRCRTLEDMRDVQTRFFRTAVEQYGAELNRLMQIGADTVQRSLASHPH